MNISTKRSIHCILRLLIILLLGLFLLSFSSVISKLDFSSGHEEAEKKKLIFTGVKKQLKANSTEVDTDRHYNDMDNVNNRSKDSSLVTEDAPVLVEQYHLIVSTGCNSFQDWQSYLFFYHAMRSKQQGLVTRIASGCNEKKEKDLRMYHEKYIETMSPNFRLHFTPDYSEINFKGGNSKQRTFKYFNKPFGVLHWMEHALGYPANVRHDDTIIILMDPDQIILRPLINDFKGMDLDERNKIEIKMNSSSSEHRNSSQQQNKKTVLQVDHGYPFAQLYGFHGDWKRKTFPNITHIIPPDELPTPAQNISSVENYSVGPPYFLTARDMYKLVVKWAEFAPKVHDIYPELLAEMYAYSLAAAHLRLPHQIVKNVMISNPAVPNEGWTTIQSVPQADVCGNVNNNIYLPSGIAEKTVRDRRRLTKLPVILHYCLRVGIGKWFFSKYKLPKSIFSCKFPLPVLPPTNLATLYDFAIFPGKSRQTFNAKQVNRQAYMVCTILKALNEASRYFKRKHCSNETANFKEELIFFKDVNNTNKMDDWLDLERLARTRWTYAFQKEDIA